MEYLIAGGASALYPMVASDLDDRVCDWFQRSSLVKYYSRHPARFTRDRLVEDIEQGWANASLFTFAVRSLEDRKIVGVLRLGPNDWTHGLGDMPLIIGDREALPKGFASEVVRLGNALAFKVCGLRKLHGGVYEANRAALISYGRAGWLEQGRLSGHYWVDDAPMDRILVACYNPLYFPSVQLGHGALLYSPDEQLGDVSKILDSLNSDGQVREWLNRSLYMTESNAKSRREEK